MTRPLSRGSCALHCLLKVKISIHLTDRFARNAVVLSFVAESRGETAAKQNHARIGMACLISASDKAGRCDPKPRRYWPGATPAACLNARLKLA
ncbi:hypothetical protein ACVW1C_007439 [Bradyrhizobium sp. USDA 4011]